MTKSIVRSALGPVVIAPFLLFVACGGGVSSNGAATGGNVEVGSGGTSATGSGGMAVATGGGGSGGTTGSTGGRTGGARDAGTTVDAFTDVPGMGASGGVGVGGVDAGTDDGGAAQLCVDTINMYRATLGLPPYARWTAEESCVSGEALTDSQTDTAHSAFGTCSENAQNECPGWTGSLESIVTGCLKQMWAEGPGSDFNAHGHYINMSSTAYTRAACGFATAANGKIWAAQDFK